MEWNQLTASFVLQRSGFFDGVFLETRKQSVVYCRIHSLANVSLTLTFDSLTLKS